MLSLQKVASFTNHKTNQHMLMGVIIVSFFFGVLLLSREANGQQLTTFLAEHKTEIQNYIMAGYGKGWLHCDVLSLTHHGDVPHFIMGFETLNKVDIGIMMSSSHCLLAAYHIESKESLSAIIQFGWTVIKHKRIALILSIGEGVTLDMASNTKKMPFLIAAKWGGGKKQFLCPIVGRQEPFTQSYMCNVSYASYRYKKLRTGIYGHEPHIFPTKNGIDGTTIRLLKLLAKKLKFVPHIVIPRSFHHAFNLVRNNLDF